MHKDTHRLTNPHTYTQAHTIYTCGKIKRSSERVGCTRSNPTFGCAHIRTHSYTHKLDRTNAYWHVDLAAGGEERGTSASEGVGLIKE